MRVGVIGAGGQGRVRAAAYARNPGAELVSIAGRNPARARALANEYSTTTTRDAAELLEDPSIESDSICSPHAAPSRSCGGGDRAGQARALRDAAE